MNFFTQCFIGNRRALGIISIPQKNIRDIERKYLIGKFVAILMDGIDYS